MLRPSRFCGKLLTTLGPVFRRSCRPRCRKQSWPNASSNLQRAANAIESACVLPRWTSPLKQPYAVARSNVEFSERPPRGGLSALFLVRTSAASASGRACLMRLTGGFVAISCFLGQSAVRANQTKQKATVCRSYEAALGHGPSNAHSAELLLLRVRR